MRKVWGRGHVWKVWKVWRGAVSEIIRERQSSTAFCPLPFKFNLTFSSNSYHPSPQHESTLVRTQTVLLKEQPLQYNKENLLNPFFVVFGRRKVEPTAEEVADNASSPWAALTKLVAKS